MTERQQDIIARTFVICFVSAGLIITLIPVAFYLAYKKIRGLNEISE